MATSHLQLNYALDRQQASLSGCDLRQAVSSHISSSLKVWLASSRSRRVTASATQKRHGVIARASATPVIAVRLALKMRCRGRSGGAVRGDCREQSSPRMSTVGALPLCRRFPPVVSPLLLLSLPLRSPPPPVCEAEHSLSLCASACVIVAVLARGPALVATSSCHESGRRLHACVRFIRPPTLYC